MIPLLRPFIHRPIATLLLGLFGVAVLGQAPCKAASTFTETFTYTDATALVGAGTSPSVWTIIGTTTTNALTVSGGAVSLAASGQDAGVALSSGGTAFSVTTGSSIFAGFDINLSAALTGDYCFAFSGSASSSTYYGKLYVKASGTGYVLGMGTGTSTSPTYSSTVLNFGTTYRVVMRYDIVSGSANDTAMFYIDPTSTTEASNTAAVSATIASAASGEPSAIAAVALRQGSSTAAATITSFDNLIVSTTFSAAANITTSGTGAPTVSSTTPSNGATIVSTASTVTVVFDQSVMLADGWYTVVGSSSGTHTCTVSGSGTTYVITPASSFAEAETVALTIAAAAVTNSSGTAMEADYTASFTTALDSSTIRKIDFIQGSGTASAYAGQTLSVQGIVTGFYLNSSGGRAGFYLQEEDADADSDATTSEGIYVYMTDNTASLSSTLTSLAVGDQVTVTGTVKEYSTLTELATVSVLTINSSGNTLPAATSLTLPLASSTYLERYEGMRVTLPQTLTVTDTQYLGQYGEFAVSSGGLLAQPTNVVAPGSTAYTALVAANALNYLLIDDATAQTYLDPTSYLYTTETDTSTRTLRCGDTTTGITGVVTYAGSSYMIEPTSTVSFANAHPRSAPPTAAGNVRVVGANVLNFFNGDGAGSSFPTSRGADTYVEYQRQRAHVVAALYALNADIYGLTELENDGFGSTSAIQDLVNGLNTAATAAGSSDTFAFVDLSSITGSAVGSDEITCGFIYKTTTVSLVGAAAVNTSSTFNRPPIAQTFALVSNGETFTVSINHFKSKSSSSATGSNADQSDGQSAWNYLRTQQASALTAWLATDPTGSGDSDFLIIGDLNSYAKEDPITTITSAGYTNLVEQLEGAGGYSYAYDGQFGHLDHALATTALAAQAVAAESWHNNSVEPEFIDYNVENKSTSGTNYTTNTVDARWRASDHDPVLIDFLLLSPQQTWRSTYFGTTSGSGTAADSADPDGDGIPNLLEYALGTDPTAAASATLPTGTIESSNFVFRFTRPIDTTDITYTVQTSTDLVTWTTLATTSESSTTSTETLIATLTPSATKQFVRLTVGSLSTVPVGYMNYTIAGSGATTAFSLQLDDDAAPATGIRAGKIETFTATTLTNGSAGWTSGSLYSVSTPWVVRLTSGSAIGKVLTIASNTATTITISGSSLTTLGVVIGDTFELVPVDTLNTFFGSSTLTGGTSSGAADLVKAYSGSLWTSYFYSTALSYWRLTSTTVSQNNLALRTSSGLLVTRRGATLTLTVVGRVLGTTFRVPVANAGNTLINSGYPIDTTLADLAVQSKVSGWRSGTSSSTADQVLLYNGSAWVGYVFNGTNWQTLSDGTNSDSVAIAAGSPLLISRPGTTTGTTDFIRSLPY